MSTDLSRLKFRAKEFRDKKRISMAGGIGLRNVIGMIRARLVREAPRKINTGELAILRERLDELRRDGLIESRLRNLSEECFKAAGTIGGDAAALAAEGCEHLADGASFDEFVRSDAFLRCDIGKTGRSQEAFSIAQESVRQLSVRSATP
jgi:hypothetical protein